ncbi:uncharacterized protein NPIL_164581 [Nephila pilipes]|uniref:Gustatory receptor n=1 Tax=Nephila pilipes TaxID=299642 RepID=A0A8X6Q4F2_NEPPI|nr:uncharacterized protein NPIL_164581 [Nephila pilipes]
MKKNFDIESTIFHFTKSSRKGSLSKDSSSVPLCKVFLPLLKLLYLAGVEALPCPARIRKRKLSHWIWKCPRYIMNFLLSFSIFSQLLTTLIVPEKKIEIAAFIVFLFEWTAHISMRRIRNQFKILLKELSKISSILFNPIDHRKIKRLFIICIAFICFVNITYYWSFYYSYTRAKMQLKFLNSSTVVRLLKVPPQYFQINLDITTLCFPITFGIPFYLLIVYYNFICGCLKSLFHEIVLQLRDKSAEYRLQQLLEAYDRTTSLMKALDYHFSYSILVVVFSSMAALFWVGCNIVFAPKLSYLSYAFPLIYGIYYLSLLVTVILAASVAVDAGKLARDAVLSLPGLIPKHYKELKIRVSNNYKRDTFLTLWKIYDIDKSLLISAFGTLLTYGILIANLKSV